MELKVNIIKKSGGRVIVSPFGPIDTDTHEALKAKIDPLLGPETRALILDMTNVDYISSIGLSLVFQIKGALESTGRAFVMAHLQPNVQRIFKAVKMMLGPFVASLKEADIYLDDYLKDIADKGA